MQVILKGEIIQKLKEVGLKSGDTVMVHTSLGKMGYVCGGAQAVIEALMEVVGDSGTIMMPTQSWKNLDPETGVHWEAEQKYLCGTQRSVRSGEKSLESLRNSVCGWQ